jgi:catechol 2,3-dioxygenase
MEGVMGEPPVHPDVRIGHVHLRVSDLERSTAFYRDVLGFEVTLFGPDIGITAAWLAAGGYHHHIALNTWTSAGGSPAPLGHTGLDHVAILYPNRRELARAARRVLAHGHALTSAERDSVRVAVYLRDPDGNGLELYCDRPRDEWPIVSGKPRLTPPEKFDPAELMAEPEE